MTQNNQEAREAVADVFQDLADTDTFFRLKNAPMVGELIASSEPDWGVARAAAALVLTDATDGFWARTAKKVRGRDVFTEGAAKDPEADHLTVDSILGGLIAREQKGNRKTNAIRLSQIKFRSQTRNERMDENRRIVRNHPENIDPKEMRASSLNKAKMVFQVLGGIAMTSPLSERPVTRELSLGVLQLGTWLGEIGERQFRGKVQHLLAEKHVKRSTTAKPNHLKDR